MKQSINEFLFFHVQLMKFFVYSLVYLHIFAIISWSLPEAPSHLKIGIQKFSTLDSLKHWSAIALYWNQRYLKTGILADYLTFIGAKQNWNMFAPNPIRYDRWVDAEVLLSDGSTVYEVFPRPYKESYGQSFIKERYWKFIEAAASEQHAVLWPQLATYLARKRFEKDSENPPVHIKLRRHTRLVMPPGEKQPEDFETFLFFETPLSVSDFS